MVYERVASKDKALVWLENSGHNLLADGEREVVWAQSFAWLMARVPRPAMPTQAAQGE
jgi:esterase/lipase